MAKTVREERLRWVFPIVTGEIRLVDAVRVCPYSKRSLERWVSQYKHHGPAMLAPRSTAPKFHPRETPIWMKERIIAVRKRTKKCALKIHWQLAKEGLLVHPRTIGKILKRAQLVRKYRVRKMTYTYLKAERKPGELMEIDVKYVPGRIAGKRYFQYTAIDCASRWRHLAVYDAQTNSHSILFLKAVLSRFKYPIRAIKTDNGSVFTNRYLGTYKRSDLSSRHLHALDIFCAHQQIVHYLIDPGKPAQNGTVERSHREDQEKFYEQHSFRSPDDLKRKLRTWNTTYNNLEHCGLGGKTPNEFLEYYRFTNPPNVCA